MCFKPEVPDMPDKSLNIPNMHASGLVAGLTGVAMMMLPTGNMPRQQSLFVRQVPDYLAAQPYVAVLRTVIVRGKGTAPIVCYYLPRLHQWDVRTYVGHSGYSASLKQINTGITGPCTVQEIFVVAEVEGRVFASRLDHMPALPIQVHTPADPLYMSDISLKVNIT